MKQQIKSFAITLALGLFCIYAVAQQKQKKLPRWISEKGYWVIEGNVQHPRQHTIWFYNNDNVLVYREKVDGVKLNPAKRKVRMKLKQALDSSVEAWEKEKAFQQDKGYVAAILN